MVFKLDVSSKGHPYVLSRNLAPDFDEKVFGDAASTSDFDPGDYEIRARSSKLADAMAWRPSVPLLSERAVSVLKAHAPGCAEYRYFGQIRENAYFALHVTARADVLDMAASDCLFGEDGQLLTVFAYSFDQEKLARAPILFRLPNRMQIFVKEGIARAVVENQLTGFQFRDPAKSEIKDLFFGRDVNVYPGVLP